MAAHMDFVLTSDLDWASEACVEGFLALAARYDVRATVFVTHDSAAIRRATAAGAVELGVHPNFHQPSSHGRTTDEVIDYVCRLAPGARAVRCHRHITDAVIEAALARHGLDLDSNTCRHLSPSIAPIRLASGLLRMPVFFEDDFQWMAGHGWAFSDHAGAFFSPGLKILNFHPFFVALNCPDAAFYARHKSLIPSLTAEEAARLRHRGPGPASFLEEALTAVRASGHRFITLSELAVQTSEMAGATA